MLYVTECVFVVCDWRLRNCELRREEVSHISSRY